MPAQVVAQRARGPARSCNAALSSKPSRATLPSNPVQSCLLIRFPRQLKRRPVKHPCRATPCSLACLTRSCSMQALVCKVSLANRPFCFPDLLQFQTVTPQAWFPELPPCQANLLSNTMQPCHPPGMVPGAAALSSNPALLSNTMQPCLPDKQLWHASPCMQGSFGNSTLRYLRLIASPDSHPLRRGSRS